RRSFFSRAIPPRPPGSTLFPYTTLFRSAEDSRIVLPGNRSRRSRRTAIKRTASVWPAGRDQAARDDGELARQRRTQARRATPFEDRKSTRLNSSHVKISYAVFCLKKKRY